MKRILLAALVATCLGSSTGCCLIDRLFCCPGGHGWCGTGCGAETCGDGCSTCGDGYSHDGMGHGHAGMAQQGGGAAVQNGAVAYPYYSNRGPRDFLARSPRSIGP